MKEYPTNYPEDVRTILKSMSFNDGKGLHIVGSASVRSQQYAGDYDSYQVVEMSEPTAAAAAKRVAHGWQENIKRLRALPDVYIGDIKCGEIAEWRVIPAAARLLDGKIVGYNPTQSRAKVDQLEAAKIISPAEATAARKLLPEGMDLGAFLQAKQTLKFHVIRWSPQDILRGRRKLRDGRVISLAQACQLPGMAKMDVIAKVQNSRFTDFSVIYEFRNKGRVMNPYRYDVRESLREAIVAYRKAGDSFKALKRIYTLARYENDMETVQELTPVLNSDLGRLYHIIGDMRTLVELLQQPRVPIADIRYEVDQFVGRLSNIYKLEDVLKNEGEVVGRLHAIVKMQKGKMAHALDRLADQLAGYLQYATDHILKGRKSLTGGGKYTDQMVAAAQRLFMSPRIADWPAPVRDAFLEAKRQLDNVGPTLNMDSAVYQKEEIVRRFINEIRPFNPMYKPTVKDYGAEEGEPMHPLFPAGAPVAARPAPLSVKRGLEGYKGTIAVRKPAGRKSRAASSDSDSSEDYGTAVAAPAPAPTAAAPAPAPAPAVPSTAASAAELRETEEKTSYAPSRPRKGRGMKGGGPFKDELIAIANQLMPGSGTYVREHINDAAPEWRTRFEAMVAEYYRQMAVWPARFRRAEKRRILEQAAVELQRVADELIMMNSMEQRIAHLRAVSEGRRLAAARVARPRATTGDPVAAEVVDTDPTEGSGRMKGGATWRQRLWAGIGSIAAAIAGGVGLPTIMGQFNLATVGVGTVVPALMVMLGHFYRNERRPDVRAIAAEALRRLQTMTEAPRRAPVYVPELPHAAAATASRSVAVTQPPAEADTRITFNPMRAATRSTVASTIGTGRRRTPRK